MNIFPRRKNNKKQVTLKSPVLNPELGLLEVDGWELSEFVVKSVYPIVGTHPFPINEQLLMVATICRFRPSYIFEWGTHIGKSARIFWEASSAFGINSQIHSMDLPDDEDHVEHPGEERGRLVKDLPKVRLHQSDGVSTALKIYKAKSLKDKTCLFYVDGDHSYDSVYYELSEILKQTVNPIILLHDTFNQQKESGYNTGPFRAINKCLKESNKPFNRFDTTICPPGMTLLYPRI